MTAGPGQVALPVLLGWLGKRACLGSKEFSKNFHEIHRGTSEFQRGIMEIHTKLNEIHKESGNPRNSIEKLLKPIEMQWMLYKIE